MLGYNISRIFIYQYTRYIEIYWDIIYQGYSYTSILDIFCKTKFRGFSNLIKIKFCWRQVLEILTFHKLPWGHVRSHKKIGPDQFSRLLDTNGQTDKQSMYIDFY